MNAKKVSIGSMIAISGSFLAFAIGAGFSSGQEILQYFTSYGMKSILVALFVVVVQGFILAEFIITGKREQFARGGDIYRYYCGKWIGGFYDYFTVLFVYMSFIVMVGGACATLNQYFNAPYIVGGIALAILSGITVLFGLKSIVSIIGKIGPTIIIIMLAIAIPNLLTGDVTHGLEVLPQQNVLQAGNSWFTSGWSYVGFGLLWYAPFLAELGKTCRSKVEAGVAMFVGVFIFAVAALIVSFSMLSHIELCASVSIPVLALANALHPIFGLIFSVIVLAAIYSSAVPLLWTSSSPFANEKTAKGKVIIIGMVVLATIIAYFVPYARLINIIYVINGYIGGILIIFTIVKMIMRIRKKKISEEPSSSRTTAEQ